MAGRLQRQVENRRPMISTPTAAPAAGGSALAAVGAALQRVFGLPRWQLAL